MALFRSTSWACVLFFSVPLQEAAKDKPIQELLARKFDWGAEQMDLTLYLTVIQSHYCEGLQLFIDPVAVPDPSKVFFTVKASPEVSVGEALTRDLKTQGLRLTIWESIVLITTEKGKEDFEKSDWTGLSAKALEGRLDLGEKLNTPHDFKICPFDPRKALELLSKKSGVAIDASRIPEEPPSKQGGRPLHPGKASLRAALTCYSRATRITFQVTEKGLTAVPPRQADR